MIKLQTQFTTNADKTGDMTFEQVKRTSRVAMYKRTYPNGKLHSYEVFEIFVVKAGAKLPNGCVVAEDYEKYCTANSRNAYFCSSEARALIRYKELIAQIANRTIDNVTAETTVGEVVETSGNVTRGKRGRKSVVRPEIVIPTTPTFTINDILKLNSSWTKPTLYLAVKSHSGIKFVGTKQNVGCRGKATNLYGKIKFDFST